jgi:hypothetical protein
MGLHLKGSHWRLHLDSAVTAGPGSIADRYDLPTLFSVGTRLARTGEDFRVRISLEDRQWKPISIHVLMSSS